MISVKYVNKTDISNLLSVDIVTLLIAIIFLSLIIIVVGWASAISNATFAWIFFHIFMFALLLVEIVVSLFTSNLKGFLISANNHWDLIDDDERIEFQDDLGCCGFLNITDRSAGDCGSSNVGCLFKLQDILITIRNTSSVAMFVCFVFGLFIDFAGCAICFHPDVVTLADQEKELAELAAQQIEMEAYANPFAHA